MKKILVFILTFVYMAVSSGMAMEIHYCMGKKAGVDFFKKKDGKCSKCGMKEKKGCCNDEHKFYKLEGSYKNVSNDISFAGSSEAIVNNYVLFDWQLPLSSTIASVNNHSPPASFSPSLSILYCVFRL